MPNRIIREGIIDSPRVEKLVRDAGWSAEVFYRRLQQVVDDFGRFDGRLAMLKARCYPTVIDLIRDADMERWIAACVKSGLVRVYEVSGNRYLELHDFRQQRRATTSKYPSPVKCVADATHTISLSEASAHLVVDEGAVVDEGDKRVPKPKPASLILPFESESFREAWEDFVSMRSEIKKPLKPTAIKLSLGKLAEMGESAAIQSLRESTANQWQGLFPPKDAPPALKKPPRICESEEQFREFQRLHGGE